MKKIIILLFFSLSLISCSTLQERKMRENIVKNIKLKNYNEALKIAKSNEFYENKNSILLKNLELGTLYYLDNKYYQALKYFEKAKKISDDLYTVSVNKKITSIWDENMDNYYGERYERSMIRFYLSLINYNLYKQGFYEEYFDENNIKVKKKILNDSEKNFHLNYARSSIIEWDSLLKTYQAETGGEAVYKNDMIAKVWGAFIHSEFNRSVDKQIALQLYKDGNELLLRNYNMYPIFNNNYEKFNKDFKILPNIPYQELKKRYISNTQYSNDLIEYLNKNIKNLSSSKKDNLVILIKNSFISPKTVKTIRIPIPIAFFGNSYSEMESFIRLVMISENGMPCAEIEIPEIKEEKYINNYNFVIYDETMDEVAKSNLIMIEPLSSIAKKNLDDKIGIIKTKIISRIAVKYAAAAASSYALYNQNNSMSQVLAFATFAGAVKLINESSRADTRYWATLFSDIQIGGAILKKGKYKLVIFSDDKEIFRKDIEIKNNETTFIDLNV